MTKWLVYLISLLLPIYLIRFNIAGIPTTLLEILIYLAVISKLLQAKNLNWLKSKYTIPIILLLIAGVVSIFITPEKTVGLGLFKAFIIDPILLFLIVKDFFPQEKNTSLKFLALSTAYVSLHAIYQYFTGNMTPDNRVIGLFGYSPNYLAFYSAPLIMLNFGLATQSYLNKAKDWFLWFGLFLISFWALILSDSRASIIAVLIGLVIYLIGLNWQSLKK